MDPIFLVETTGTCVPLSYYCTYYTNIVYSSTANGFSGAYGHESDDINNMLLGVDAVVNQRRRKRQTDDSTSDNGPQFAGIDDPTVCLELGQVILFQVSNVSYPVYDVDNLLNTNTEFDFGLFSLLSESLQLSASEEPVLFPYRFSVSGVYVFHLSIDVNRKTYIRAVDVSAECPEQGPFFPTTPSMTTQLGLVRSDDILLSPNWILIGSLLAGAVLLMAVLTIALVSVHRDIIFPAIAAIHLKRGYKYDTHVSM